MLRTLPPTYRLVEDTSPFGKVIRVTLNLDLIPLAEEVVTFELHLEGRFPFTAPKLYCRTAFTKPSFADGRDLLKDVMSIQWTPSLTLSDIVHRLPEFVNSTAANITTLDPFEVGHFHLGQPINMSFWDFQLHMGIFRCQEIDGAVKKERYMAVSETVIIELEPSTQYPQFGHMLSWASIYSLDGIQRQKKDPERLIFKWKQMGEEAAYQQTLLMPEAEACIGLISANMRALGVLVKKRNPIATLKEEEVTVKSVKKIHINEILETIAVYESNFETNMNLYMINSLMELYQQAIEYFSALNDPRYDVFLDKLHTMLSNDIVQTLLRSGPAEERRESPQKASPRKEEPQKEAHPSEPLKLFEPPQKEAHHLFPPSVPKKAEKSEEKAEISNEVVSKAEEEEKEIHLEELSDDHSHHHEAKSHAIAQEAQMHDLTDAVPFDNEAIIHYEEHKEENCPESTHAEGKQAVNDDPSSNEKAENKPEDPELQALKDDRADEVEELGA
mmetsp:Transcript_29426/g.52678  ORF Transcript_29426/g.52678 Transcript_29426/m.52678 type:complete len:501 (+) Transcript_29426:63-1565(+)